MLLSVAYTMPFQSRAFCDLQYAISRMPVMFINLKKMGKNRNIAINWECECLLIMKKYLLWELFIVYSYVFSCCRLDFKQNK